MTKEELINKIKSVYDMEAPDRFSELIFPKTQTKNCFDIRQGFPYKKLAIGFVTLLFVVCFLFTVPFFTEKDKKEHDIYKNNYVTQQTTIDQNIESTVTDDTISTNVVEVENVVPNLYYTLEYAPDYVIPTDINSMYSFADVVVKATYTERVSIGIKHNIPIPITTGKVEIKDVLKGEINDSVTEINYYGGYVTVWDYVNKMGREVSEKCGLNNISKEEAMKRYIGIEFNERSVKASVNKQYLLFLSYDDNTKEYFVLCDGYGMRELNNMGEAWNIDLSDYESIKKMED